VTTCAPRTAAGTSPHHKGSQPSPRPAPFPRERANAQLKTWRILRNLRCRPWRAGQLAKAIHVLQTREATPALTDDHELLNDFAEALGQPASLAGLLSPVAARIAQAASPIRRPSVARPGAGTRLMTTYMPSAGRPQVHERRANNQQDDG
jgi:hypothetical protein